MARQNPSSSPASGATPAKVKKTRWYHNVWQAYRMTREVDPAASWWMLASFVVVLGIAVVLGLVFSQLIYWLIIGIPFALLAPLAILARRTERAAYRRIEGTPGASLTALKTIRRGWEFGDEPVAMDARNQDMVFRGVGRPGVVLVAEGPPHRATRMLEAERKKVARILPQVPVTLIQVGDGEDQVPLSKLARRVTKLKPVLDRQATAEVSKRLRALGGIRLPVPKGVDPYKVRPDRKGMRGR